MTTHRVGIQRDANNRIVSVNNPYSPSAKVTVVAGPPSSGKTTYVAEHRQPHDLVIDLDAIAVALGSPEDHGHSRALWPFITACQDALLAKVGQTNEIPHVWIIRGAPRLDQRHLYADQETIVLETTPEQAWRWAFNAGRPNEWRDLITKWWDNYQPHSSDTVIRNG